MQKKLTILFAFAIFVLIVGMPNEGYACHKEGTTHGKQTDCAPGGGGVDIPLCVTLAEGNGPGIGGNGGERTFCDGEVHEQARINRTTGVLEVSLFS